MPKKPVVAVVEDKNSVDNATGQGGSEAIETALIQQKPIQNHMLPLNEPHPCDKYGAHENLNTNSETATIATTKRLVILEKSQKLVKKKALN